MNKCEIHDCDANFGPIQPFCMLHISDLWTLMEERVHMFDIPFFSCRFNERTFRTRDFIVWESFMFFLYVLQLYESA